MGREEPIPIERLNRLGRRRHNKKFGTKLTGIQDSKESTHEIYYIPTKRKSKAGVEYTYYKQVVDVKGLRK